MSTPPRRSPEDESSRTVSLAGENNGVVPAAGDNNADYLPSHFMAAPPPMAFVEVPDPQHGTMLMMDCGVSSVTSSFGSTVSRQAQRAAANYGSPPRGFNPMPTTTQPPYHHVSIPEEQGPPAMTGFRLKPRNGTSSKICTPSPSERGRKRTAQSMSSGLSLKLVGHEEESPTSASTGSTPPHPPASPGLNTTALSFQGLSIHSPGSLSEITAQRPPMIAMRQSSKGSYRPAASSPASHTGSCFSRFGGTASPTNTEESSLRILRTNSSDSTTGGGGDRSSFCPMLPRASPPPSAASSPKIVPVTVLPHGGARPPQSVASAAATPPRSAFPGIVHIETSDIQSETPNDPIKLQVIEYATSPGHVPTMEFPHGKGSVLSSHLTPRSAKDTPLPKISLSPRSSNNHGGLPRFPSPTEDIDIMISPMLSPKTTNSLASSQVHRPGFPTDCLTNDSGSVDLLVNDQHEEDENEAPRRTKFIPFPDWCDRPPPPTTIGVSQETSPAMDSSASAAAAAALPMVSRSILHPSTSRGSLEGIFNSGRVADAESLSDCDGDEFLLASPSAITEEKKVQKQQRVLSRQSKLPRLHRSSMTSMASSSCSSFRGTDFESSSSLRGLAFAASTTSLGGMELVASSSSLRGMDGRAGSIGRHARASPQLLRREESSGSIGLALESALPGEAERDLTTPPAMAQPSMPPPLSPRFGLLKDEGTHVAKASPSRLFARTASGDCDALKNGDTVSLMVCHHQQKEISPRST